MTPQGLRVDVTPSTGISFTAPDGSPTGKDWGWRGDSGHAHMLVLDRTTLQSYPYTLPTDATIDSTLDANLQPFLPGSTSSSFLAILTGAPGCCDASKTLPHGMGFSYVFVPRTGKDDIRTGVSNEGLEAVLGRAAEPGEITGALQPSPDRGSGSLMSTVFSFTQTDVLPYDTNASVDPAAGRTLLIQSIGTSMVVDNPGGTQTNGQPMEMYTRLDNQNQGWTLTDTGAGGGYVELVNQASGLCLDATGDGGGAPGPGAVVQATCTGRPGQLWHWDRAPGTESVYYLSPQAAPKLVLTVAGPNTNKLKTGLTLLDNQEASVQQWRFTLPGATFRVGDRTYNVPPPDAPEWWTQASFAVLALDPSGDPLPGSPTSPNPNRFDVIDPTRQGLENGAMYEALKNYTRTPGTTVLIQSIRNPSHARQHQDWSYWRAIGEVISGFPPSTGPGLGGSQWAFDRLTDEGGYAFVGCAGCRDAAQSAYAVTRNADDGRLSGLLVRDGQSRLAPLLSTPGDEYDADVTSLASQAPKPWPASSTPAEKAMLGYVADQLKLRNMPYPGCAALAPVRDAYCNANFAGAVEQNELTKQVSCAAPFEYNSQTIDTDTCNSVRSQLFDEFGDVELVQKYIANLKAPLVMENGNTFLDLGALTNAVNDQVKAPLNANVGWSFYEIVESLGEAGVTVLAEQFPALEVGWTIATQAINATRTAAELIGRDDEAADGTSADELTTAVSQLGSELQARFKNAASNLSRLGALLVSDHDKLETAAEKTKGPWEVPLPSQDEATNTIRAGARQWLYTSLMHEAYQLHSWDVCAPWGNHGSYCYWVGGPGEPNPVYTMYCEGGNKTWPSRYKPFKDKGEPLSATFVQEMYNSWDPIKWLRAMAIARGPIQDEDEGQGGRVPSSFAVPSDHLTNPLFQPVGDLSKPDSGGVGLHPEYFFEPSQWTVIDDNKFIPMTEPFWPHCLP